MTTIGPETRINGRVEGEADVLVEGRVDGTIVLSATLTVAPGGFVTGDVEANVVVIEGYASGTIRASQVVHLTSTAQVEGEIFATAVRLDSGARLRGRIEMDVAAAPPLASRPERPARKPQVTKPDAREEAPRAHQKSEAPATQNTRKLEPARSTPKPKPKAKQTATSSATLTVDPDALSVKELREMLTERGLALSGTKSELVRRLRASE